MEEIMRLLSITELMRGTIRLPRWLEKLFAFMQRNSVHVSDFFRLPPDSVVEIGRQVSI
jgi:K+ transporter